MVMRGGLLFNYNRRAVQRFRQLAISAVGSVKIKLLLSFCIAFTVFLLLSRGSKLNEWADAEPLDRFSSPRKGYAILMNTWKRYDLLKQSISHYSKCPGLDSIHIVWSEPNPPSVSLQKFLQHVVQKNSRDGRQVELKFDINDEDSLNNRFKEIKDLEADAVFSIDDDIIFPCHSVQFAFDVWRSAPDQMVGFVPRKLCVESGRSQARSKKEDCVSSRQILNKIMLRTLALKDPCNRSHLKEGKDYYTYCGWWSVWWTGTYSMILSKAAFFHKKYLRMYTNEMPTSIKEFVSMNRNCEDIAMSFLVANTTDAPPIWVKGQIYEIGSTGISTLGGHSNKRTQCINRFVAEFGRMPLAPTSMKAVDSRHTWLW